MLYRQRKSLDKRTCLFTTAAHNGIDHRSQSQNSCNNNNNRSNSQLSINSNTPIYPIIFDDNHSSDMEISPLSQSKITIPTTPISQQRNTQSTSNYSTNSIKTINLLHSDVNSNHSSRSNSTSMESLMIYLDNGTQTSTHNHITPTANSTSNHSSTAPKSRFNITSMTPNNLSNSLNKQSAPATPTNFKFHSFQKHQRSNKTNKKQKKSKRINKQIQRSQEQNKHKLISNQRNKVSNSTTNNKFENIQEINIKQLAIEKTLKSKTITSNGSKKLRRKIKNGTPKDNTSITKFLSKNHKPVPSRSMIITTAINNNAIQNGLDPPCPTINKNQNSKTKNKTKNESKNKTKKEKKKRKKEKKKNKLQQNTQNIDAKNKKISNNNNNANINNDIASNNQSFTNETSQNN